MFLSIRPWNQDKNYVYIKKDNAKPDDYCASPIGKKDGQNKMVLNNNCFDYNRLMHQFVHVLGFAHKNQRPGQILNNFDPPFSFIIGKNHWMTPLDVQKLKNKYGCLGNQI